MQAKCKIFTRLGFGKSQSYIFACALCILDNNLESTDKSSIFGLGKYGLTFLEVVTYFLEYLEIGIALWIKCILRWAILTVILTYITIRVTSLEQLSLAEFSGESTRPKVYENGHKKVLGIWLDLVLKVKYSEILIFKVIFLCRKSAESLQNKISLKNTKSEINFYYTIFW